MSRDWSLLPDTALVSIMAEVPLQHRLSCCALVSTSWASAAAVATREMCLTNCPDASSVTARLSSSYSSINSLQIEGGPKQLLSELPPLPHLQELQLFSVHIQLGPACDQPGILRAATGLTHLLLQDVTLAHGLEGASVLTSLRSLSVTDCTQPPFSLTATGDSSSIDAAGGASTEAKPEPVSIPGRLFLQLLRLTHLELRGGLSDCSLQHISRLTRLDSLAIDFEGSSTSAAALHGLDKLRSLTFLALTDTDIPISTDTLPGLSELTNLRALWLYNCRSIDPMLLMPLTNLQHLDMDTTVPAGDAKGAAALLAVLPRLQYLSHLDLCECLNDSTAAPAAAYSALTVGSRLSFLDIQYAEPPLEAWPHLFPTGRQLTQLQRLHMSGIHSSHADGLDEQQLRHLVQVCPNLQNLQCSLLQPSVCADALLQLTALTGLALEGVSTDLAECVLVKLKNLEELHIVPDSSIDDMGLLTLTALTQLSQLGIHHSTCSPEFSAEYEKLAVRDGEDVVLLFDAEHYRPGTPRNVWLQLLRCCVKSPKCQTELLFQLPMLDFNLFGRQFELDELEGYMQSLRRHKTGSSSVKQQLALVRMQQEAEVLQTTLRDLVTAKELLLHGRRAAGMQQL